MLNMLKTSFTKVKPNALPGLRYGVFQERNGIVRGRVGILGITFLNEAPAQLVGVGVAEVLQASRGTRRVRVGDVVVREMRAKRERRI